MKSRFLIAAAHSGAGKTTVTLGLLRALQKRGCPVQPFKCGPDYLDPKHHFAACNNESINLDRFMMSDSHILQLYQDNSINAAVCITEGVMGLFDGSLKMEGSSADIARLLQMPVILVLNAKAMAYSAAAILYGLKNFCRDIHIAGVIFNFVERESHYRILEEACNDAGVKALGYLPYNEEVVIASRHLGLDASSDSKMQTMIAAAAIHIEKHIDIDTLLQSTQIREQPVPSSTPALSAGKLKILVARDAAFNFIYPENIRALQKKGTVQFFSPLTSDQLPAADLIYLPGGYPELYLQQLSANQFMQQQLQRYYANGGKILAECGGMMYLGKSIADEQGKTYPMTGILDITTSMQHKKISLGYRTIRAGDLSVKGHEFHYSRFTGPVAQRGNIQVYSVRNEPVDAVVFSNEQLFASYIHLYWGENPDLIDSLFHLP
ncbi:cobyrinic acid a,c-diamide synthase [Niastella vici]|uniref:Cobyrinate a,c-diamide synthase n=1 Tax=Niastella vici TaxID=1703345 RepID=A0A1V9FTM4_9BACT|nr:cobyrinate a,c-diamide synthase [Niastella vici]OQP61704.1 cobyrinic acid a,c-diamide synthase [Niastella vici]